MVHANSESDENQLLRAGTICRDCNINFNAEEHLFKHLLRFHIKQPRVVLVRHPLTPIKLTIKVSKNEGFRIVSPKSQTPQYSAADKLDQERRLPRIGSEYMNSSEVVETNDNLNLSAADNQANVGDMQNIDFQTMDQTMEEILDSSAVANNDESAKDSGNTFEIVNDTGTDCDFVPGGEPTPPPETPEIPKLRIKTGLLQTPSTTDAPIEEIRTPGALESTESLSSLFKNNDRAKDLGFTTSDPDFMPSDLVKSPYCSTSDSIVSNSLATIGNIPMEQLAHQVSRLQNGMHQQNVLINIQHFPSPPQPPTSLSYPPMYQQQPQPQQVGPPPQMYQQGGPRYQFSGNSMYPQYPQQPGPGYPPQHPSQMPQGMPPPMGQQMHQMQPHRPPNGQMGPPPRPSVGQMRMPPHRMPRHPGPGNMPRGRPPMQPPARSMPPGQHRMRHMQPRPRMPILQQTLTAPNPNTRPPLKRPTEQTISNLKKARMDGHIPDQDDGDCEVVAVTQKTPNLPKIQSIQGNVSEPNTVHLSDSITLTTIPPMTSPKQKESRAEAKEVANVLAARGITVTTAVRPKNNTPPPSGSAANSSVSINLNNSVCIIPKKKDDAGSSTVDLTDDVEAEKQNRQNQPSNLMKPPPPPPPIATQNSEGLFECHLCPGKFPSSALLLKHRKMYHRTSVGPEFGIPLIDLKTPGITQRLTSYGIYHYIPLPNSNSNGMFALPILSMEAQKVGNMQDFASSILTLGPIKPIQPPRPIVKRGKPPSNC